MKVIKCIIPLSENQIFKVEIHSRTQGFDYYHYHEEAQLSLIVNGHGRLFVNESEAIIDENDVLLIGSATPHMFSFSKDLIPYIVNIYFKPDAFRSKNSLIDELLSINSLVEKASLGLKFSVAKTVITDWLTTIKRDHSNLDFYIFLLKVFKYLNNTNHKIITLKRTNNSEILSAKSRINKALELIFNAYHEKLTLDQMANVTNLSISAFSKQFKMVTNRTFTQFLTEVRINSACDVMKRHPEMTIAEIIYRSGFNNATMFNRAFKKIKHMTPSQFKKEFIKK